MLSDVLGLYAALKMPSSGVALGVSRTPILGFQNLCQDFIEDSITLILFACVEYIEIDSPPNH